MKPILSIRLSSMRSAFLTTVFVIALFGNFSAGAQHILIVNDNDNITYNTDTIKNDLLHTIYSTYSYWSIPDSAYRVPSDTLMETFDLVVWYASTDGVGLKFWDTTTAGIPQVVHYANTGRPLWIIGQDLLYDKYVEGTSFNPGDFAYDYMGLLSYDVQSYVDDGALGLPEADRVSTASTLFPDMLKWEFSTLWYADGCTPQTTTLGIYEMGPASYALAGKLCMFHNHTSGYSVMSTFFDPALIDSFDHRVTFMQNGITYLLGGTGVKDVAKAGSFHVFPNPASDIVNFELNSDKANTLNLEVTDITGKRLMHQRKAVQTGANTWSNNITAFAPGRYIIKVTDDAGIVIAVKELVKN